MEHDINWWKEEIKKNPKKILEYKSGIKCDELLLYAIDCGYKLNKSDLKGRYQIFSIGRALHVVIDKKPNYIKYIRYNLITSEGLDIKAYENGFRPSLIDARNNMNVQSSKVLMKYVIEKHPSLIKYVRFFDEELIKFAIEKGYKPKLKDVQKYRRLKYSDSIFETLIKEDPEIIKLYQGNNDDLIQEAINNGYSPSIDDIRDNSSLGNSEIIVKKLIDNDVTSIRFYQGKNEDIFKYACEKGLNTDKIIKIFLEEQNLSFLKISSLSLSPFIMRTLIDMDPSYFKYYGLALDDDELNSGISSFNFDFDLLNYAINNGFQIDDQFIARFKGNEQMMLYLIDINPSYIEKADPITQNLYIKAIDNGYTPSIDKVIEYEESNKSIITPSLVRRKPEVFNYYKGNDEFILKTAIEMDLLKKDDIGKNLNPYLLYIYYKHTQNVEFVEEYKSNFEYDFVYKLINGKSNFTLSNLGYVSPRDINHIHDNSHDMKILIDILNNSSVNDCCSYIKKFGSEKNEFFEIMYEKKLKDVISRDGVELIGSYPRDLDLFVKKIDDFLKFLAYCNINKDDFIQYGLGNSFDYLSEFDDIVNNGNVEHFIKLKNYLFAEMYVSNNKVDHIKNFLHLLKSYSLYPELINDIMNQQGPLSQKELSNLNFLFNNDLTLEEELLPKRVSDLQDIDVKLKCNFGKKIIKKPETEEELQLFKDNICFILFGKSLNDVETTVSNYSGREGLRQLIFENRSNKDFIKEILEPMMLLSFMEDVVNINNADSLFNLAKKIYDNFELAIECKKMYSGLDEMLRTLFEHELDLNLSKIDFSKDISSLVDKEMTLKTGVETIDFSDKAYCLLLHTLSRNETADSLVNGTSTTDQIVISTSVASHRNLSLYGSEDRIIFATDEIADGVFLRSSNANMSTNADMKKNSFEDRGAKNARQQRGALSTSIAPNENNASEVLTFRDGIKFKYIVIPGGREPTEKEIDIAKKYSLKFIKTQGLLKTIPNPKEIEKDLLIKSPSKHSEQKDIDISGLSERIIPESTGPRKIAIFGDAHGLFEPTLAILEDIRKKGISEIYSLGDNIGTGPNPREVIELLGEYGVKSIKGNHEGYVVDGIEKYMEHLKKSGAVDEARRNIEYAQSQLTSEQMEQIGQYPESIEIGLDDEKSLLLTHYSRDYEDGKLKDIPDNIDMTIQGHVHHKTDEDKIKTLRGVGIGNAPELSVGEHKAYYSIITINPDGTYTIEDCYVPFNFYSLEHDINESSMDIHDKEKISDWVGVSR